MGPFAVSATGVSVNTASGPQSLLSAHAPLMKLDVTNVQSFQTMNLLFNHEPPGPPSSGGFVDTQIDQFAHGYEYIPAFAFTWQDPAPQFPAAPPVGSSALTLFNFGDDSAASNISGVGGTTALSLFAQLQYTFTGPNTITPSNAFFYAIVDTTNVTLYVRKVTQLIPSLGAALPINIIGTSANFRYYVFAEPGTTSTY